MYVFLLLLFSTLFAENVPMTKQAICGSWKSPITAEGLATGAIQFSEVHFQHGTVYWLERRPTEKGRTALMSWSEENGEKELLTKEPIAKPLLRRGFVM